MHSTHSSNLPRAPRQTEILYIIKINHSFGRVSRKNVRQSYDSTSRK